jgi:glycosyltransferase involved in cell wall biosynthesis
MAEPLVSVVICTYNGALYLRDQLDSIVNQDYKNLEIIAGDDGSSDDSFNILQEYQAKDSRFRIYRNEKNMGYNSNFSKACEMSKGEYIAISDQDDIWELNKVSILVSALASNKENVLVHGISARFEEKSKPHLRSLKMVNYIRGNDIRKFYMLNIISGHSILFHRSLLEKSLPFPAGVYYDWWLAANACVIGKIEAVEKILVWHRMHASNATGAAKPVILFYKQIRIILPALLGISGLSTDHKNFGEKLLNHYQVFPEKKFSFSLFLFLLSNARIVFAHKKRVFPWFSYIKHSIKYAKRNTKA